MLTTSGERQFDSNGIPPLILPFTLLLFSSALPLYCADYVVLNSAVCSQSLNSVSSISSLSIVSSYLPLFSLLHWLCCELSAAPRQLAHEQLPFSFTLIFFAILISASVLPPDES